MSNPFDPTYGLSGEMGLILVKTGWFLYKATTPFKGERAYFCHPATGRIREADIRQGEELAAYDLINTLKEEK